MTVVGVWTAACAASVVISDAGLQEVALPALTGWLAALAGTRHRTAFHILGAAALVPAVISGLAVLPWLLAGVAAALMVDAASPTGVASIDELQRHLMLDRRRGQSAAVVSEPRSGALDTGRGETC